MRIERITGDRIRVTLTDVDLMRLDINIEQLTPDSKELHTFLFHIMETVREETDFNPYSGQVVVEATPSSDGISILISKLNSSTNTGERRGRIKSVKPRIKQHKDISVVYYFDDFDALCSALTNLDEDALMNAELFRMGNNYSIIIRNADDFKGSLCVLNEFAIEKSLHTMQALHIREHWSLVAEGESLAKMSKGIAELYI